MKRISRRMFVAAATAMAAFPAVAMARNAGVKLMDPKEVHDRAMKGEILFVDVRTPQEWRQTGVPEGAKPIELAPTFLAKLNELTGGDKTKPVAFICATGARSDYVAKELAKRGWENVIDVAGGIFGGPKGKGWKAEGLPMKPYGGK